MVNEKLVQLINSKGVLNVETMNTVFSVFTSIKSLIKKFEIEIKADGKINEKIKIIATDRSTNEAEIRIADDILIFIMHMNAFVFDASHQVMKSGYVKNDFSNATCGMISIYNFQSDSLKYDRKNDLGILIARMFVNKDSHFFVEGKRQLGFLFNDYPSMIATEENLKLLIEACVIYCLEIDVAVPPVEVMSQITVNEAMAYNLQSTLSTNIKLGFKFQNDPGTLSE